MNSQKQTWGLTTAEVSQLHQDGVSNYVPRITSRPVSEILRANIFTVFNGLLLVAVIAVLVVGDPRDALFGLVMVLNSVIGIVSELRAKRILDSVAVLQSPQSQVWRDGALHEIDSADLVPGDAVELSLGDQVPADGRTLESRSLQIDESILTGESRPVHKKQGDEVMSGSAVVAGSGVFLVEKVGSDSWAQKITAEAKKFSLATSEIQESINKVLKVITIALPFMVVLLMWSQVRVDNADVSLAVVFTVAGVVGMIPQGLVLLTSMNFGLAAATLARKGVLVQELPAVEILARVDQLCLDKTGTITTGGIRGHSIVWDPELTDHSAGRAAMFFLTKEKENATATAVQDYLSDQDLDQELRSWQLVPFSSSRKWAALVLPGKGTWVLGAPDILLAATVTQGDSWATSAVEGASSEGNRTLCLAHSDQVSSDEEGLPNDLAAYGIVILEEDIRPDAAQTLEYFRDQGVEVRVISGDAPATVATIAGKIGLRDDDGGDPVSVDARTLPPIGSAEFDSSVDGVQVFGRVSPDQKKALVIALQRRGHTVAMTGDGVNDALALKQADLGIAMGNGAPATKAVSRIVLMNSEFSVLPGVMAEGRRIIANMERVSALFLSKTTYAVLLAVLVSLFALEYPFLPRHLTYISWFTIGIPAFFLALAPNTQRYRRGFLRRTLSVAVPSGIIMGLAVLASYLLMGSGTAIGRTGATITLIVAGLWVLTLTARPLVTWRVALIVTMALGAALGIIIVPIRQFFALEWPTASQWGITLGVGVLACIVIEIAYRLTQRWRDSDDT